MSILAPSRPRVHSNPREFAPDVEPIRYLGDSEPFLPSLKDEAYDCGHQLARSGEDPEVPAAYAWDRDLSQCFANGAYAGKKARRIDEARELGRALGESGSGISEPPAGLSRDEAAAYREGYAAGLAEHDDDRGFAAWIASNEAERAAEAFASSITDFDVWPVGCAS